MEFSSVYGSLMFWVVWRGSPFRLNSIAFYTADTY